MPSGYKIVFREATRMGSILELIPEAETLLQWSEMLTVQVLHNRAGWTLSGYRAAIGKRWAETCPSSSSDLVEQGTEQSRPMLIWSQRCPLNKQTGKPEMTWFKVVRRDDQLIVAQKAFRFQPSVEQVAFWIANLKALRIEPSGENGPA